MAASASPPQQRLGFLRQPLYAGVPRTVNGGLSVTATIPDVAGGTELYFRFRATYRNTAGSVRSSDAYVTLTVAQRPTVAISVDNASVAEGGMATFTITYDGTAARTVDWAVSGGVLSTDYTVTGADTDGTLSFTAAGSQTLVFNITDDAVSEGAETLTVTLSNAGATDITTASATTTIAASDPAVTLAADTAQVRAGETARFTVTLGAANAAEVRVAYTAALSVDGAAVSGGITASPASPLTIAAGRTSGVIEVRVAENVFAGGGAGGGDDSVTVTLNSVIGGDATLGSPAAATVAIASTATTPAAAQQELLLPEVTRAVVGQQMNAIAGRVGNIRGGDSASFRLSGFPSLAAAHAQSLAGVDGNAADVDARELLRGLEFALPLAASHGDHGGGAGLAFWGGGDYRDFSGEDGDDDWDGSVSGFHFGVDGRVRENLRAGLMVSYSDSDSEYTQVTNGATEKGDYELDLTAVSPYLNWRLANGGSAWASVTYGSGEVEVKPDGDEASRNDVNMTGIAAGGSRRLLEQNGRELSLRADAFIAESEVEGDGDTSVAGIDNDLDVDANRLRVALAWNYPQRFSDGRLTPAFDLGLRHDGGDGRTGTGLELGGALKFRAPAVGLTLEGNARALLGHTGDHRAWGIGGLMRVESGADGQGLAVMIAPSYGDATADPQALWDGLRAGRTPADLRARLDAKSAMACRRRAVAG